MILFLTPLQEGTHHKLLAQEKSKFCKQRGNWIILDILKYHICSIRCRSHLVAAYNSIGELNKIVATLK